MLIQWPISGRVATRPYAGWGSGVCPNVTRPTMNQTYTELDTLPRRVNTRCYVKCI